MTARAEYTAEEWGLLKFTPFAAGLAVAFSDGAGVIETLRESVALVAARARGLQRYPHNELIQALLTDRSTDAVQTDAQKDLAGRPPAEAAGDVLRVALEDCRRAVVLLEDRSHPAEQEGYAQLVMDVARATALAARSGGLFGRGPLVDEDERSALGQIADALGVEVGELPVVPAPSGDPETGAAIHLSAEAGSGDAGTTPPPPDAAPGGHEVPSGLIEPR